MPRKTKKKLVKFTNKYKFDILTKCNWNIYVNESDLIENMSKHILAGDPNIYEGYNNLSKEEKLEKAKTVHSGLGKKEMEQGDYVLTFNIAGSGSAQWSKIYKGFSGYNEINELRLKEAKEEDQKEHDQILTFVKEKYNITNINAEDDEERLNEAITEEYGNPKYVDENGKIVSPETPGAKLLTGYREKITKTHTKINLSGPLAAGGMSNSGDYSIENLETYIVQYADNWLEQKANQLEKDGTIKPIHIHLKGHSRGGVTANESATLINKLIEDKYPKLKEYIDIELALYDPVPGTGSYKEHKLVDHTSKEVVTPNGIGKGLNSDSAVKNNVTVIYSIHSNHEAGFAPQEVKGANRVIMTGMNHNVGIYDIEDNHKASFIYAGNGEKYRGTGLSQLPEGVFFLDQNNILARAKTKSIAQRIIDAAIATRSKVSAFFQRVRNKIMGRTIENHFELHKEITEYLKGNEAHNDRTKTMKELKEFMPTCKEQYSRSADYDGYIKGCIAGIIFDRITETTTGSVGKEISEKDSEDQKRMLYGKKRNVEIVLADPRFDQYFSTLKEDDLQALITDYSGDKIDNMIKNYMDFFTPPQEKEDRKKESMLNRIDAADSVEPLVFAKLLQEGYKGEMILNPLALKEEKEAALKVVNEKKLTEQGRFELSGMLFETCQKTLEMLDGKTSNLKFDSEQYLTPINHQTLATAKMLGKISSEMSKMFNAKDNKDLIDKAKLMSEAFDCITEGARSTVKSHVKNSTHAAEEASKAKAYEEKIKKLNALCVPGERVSEKLNSEMFVQPQPVRQSGSQSVGL